MREYLTEVDSDGAKYAVAAPAIFSGGPIGEPVREGLASFPPLHAYTASLQGELGVQ